MVKLFGSRLYPYYTNAEKLKRLKLLKLAITLVRCKIKEYFLAFFIFSTFISIFFKKPIKNQNRGKVLQLCTYSFQSTIDFKRVKKLFSVKATGKCNVFII
jgi:hypothetical protein